MNTIFRWLSFVTTYYWYHSVSMEEHMEHLWPRAPKTWLFWIIHIWIHVSHWNYLSNLLSHIFQQKACFQMSRSQCHQNWPAPANVVTIFLFVGPVFHYCRYMQEFSDIAAPLHGLIEKGITCIRTKASKKHSIP